MSDPDLWLDGLCVELRKVVTQWEGILTPVCSAGNFTDKYTAEFFEVEK
jgi:hypothetical protein